MFGQRRQGVCPCVGGGLRLIPISIKAARIEATKVVCPLGLPLNLLMFSVSVPMRLNSFFKVKLFY